MLVKLRRTLKDNLFKRIMAAVFGMPLIVAAIFSWQGIFLSVLLCVICFLGMKEYYRITRGGRIERNPSEIFGYTGSIILIILAGKWSGERYYELVMVVLAALLIAVLSAEIFYKVHAPLKNSGVTIFGMMYVGFLLSFTMMVRNYGHPVSLFGINNIDLGSWLTLYLFICVWCYDSSAYFIGSYIKKPHRLAPSVSPGKTWEAAISATVITTLIAVAGIYLGFAWWQTLITGFSISILGQLGDLAESALKREFSIKDSGELIPGHKGVLDRFDSFLFAAPAFYFLIRLFHI